MSNKIRYGDLNTLAEYVDEMESLRDDLNLLYNSKGFSVSCKDYEYGRDEDHNLSSGRDYMKQMLCDAMNHRIQEIRETLETYDIDMSELNREF